MSLLLFKTVSCNLYLIKSKIADFFYLAYSKSTGNILGQNIFICMSKSFKTFMSFVLFFMVKIFSLSTKLIKLLYNFNAYYYTFWILLCHLKSNLLLCIHLWNWEIANHFSILTFIIWWWVGGYGGMPLKESSTFDYIWFFF